MNNEEIEKTMAFIVEQQAQFAVDIQLLQEAQGRTEQVVAQTSKVAEQTSLAVAETSLVVGQTAETVAGLAEVMTRLAEVTQQGFNDVHEGFNDVNGKINVLIDSQMRTDETVRHLASTVDRYFTEGRNGQNS